jgi:hypothetical protein
LFVGKTLLGYREKEVWRMTLRKLILLYVEYQKEKGTFKQSQSLDDVIPEGVL